MDYRRSETVGIRSRRRNLMKIECCCRIWMLGSMMNKPAGAHALAQQPEHPVHPGPAANPLPPATQPYPLSCLGGRATDAARYRHVSELSAVFYLGRDAWV